jgi:hypothetical protein
MGHTPVRRWIENGTCGVALEDLHACDAGKLFVDTKNSAVTGAAFGKVFCAVLH